VAPLKEFSFETIQSEKISHVIVEKQTIRGII
jgi:hypothetical protein